MNRYREGFDLAFVQHERKIYSARFPKGVVAPSSAVVKLLQNIFEQNLDLSFFILRNKIFTTAAFSDQDYGIVKVLAKKIEFSVPISSIETLARENEWVSVADDDEVIFSTRFRDRSFEDDPDFFNSYESVENQLVRLTLKQERGEILHDHNRPIAATLIDPQGKACLWALNSNSRNKSLHAEVNLLQKFYQREKRKIPSGYSIVVTHKPCKMCAGMIFDFCEGPLRTKVHALNNVTGCRSRWTILDVCTSKNLLNL